jgi:hypothetical protein
LVKNPPPIPFGLLDRRLTQWSFAQATDTASRFAYSVLPNAEAQAEQSGSELDLGGSGFEDMMPAACSRMHGRLVAESCLGSPRDATHVPVIEEVAMAYCDQGI